MNMFFCFWLQVLTSCWPNFWLGKRTTKIDLWPCVSDSVRDLQLILSVLFRDVKGGRIACNHRWGKVFAVTGCLFILCWICFSWKWLLLCSGHLNINSTRCSKYNNVQSVSLALAVRADCISCIMTVSLCWCLSLCWSRCLLNYFVPDFCACYV